MKLLTKELREKLLANGREQAKVKGTKAERDFWPVVKFFYRPRGLPRNSTPMTRTLHSA